MADMLTSHSSEDLLFLRRREVLTLEALQRTYSGPRNEVYSVEVSEASNGELNVAEAKLSLDVLKKLRFLFDAGERTTSWSKRPIQFYALNEPAIRAGVELLSEFYSLYDGVNYQHTLDLLAKIEDEGGSYCGKLPPGLAKKLLDDQESGRPHLVSVMTRPGTSGARYFQTYTGTRALEAQRYFTKLVRIMTN